MTTTTEKNKLSISEKPKARIIRAKNKVVLLYNAKYKININAVI